MKQTKLQSLAEALVNTFVGFIVTLSVLPIINYILDIDMNLKQASLSTVLFTIISIGRGYVVRRFFNNFKGIKRQVLKLLKIYESR